MAQIGHKRQVLDVRNGLEKKSEGDKSYRRVELSPDFHKLGSTLPPIDFGRVKKRHGHAKTYLLMKNEVIQLDNWKPVETMASAFKVFDTDPDDTNGVKYRPRFR
jgi:hypothetical protein